MLLIPAPHTLDGCFVKYIGDSEHGAGVRIVSGIGISRQLREKFAVGVVVFLARFAVNDSELIFKNSIRETLAKLG